MYNKLTVGNKSKLKRFSHKKRFDVALELTGPVNCKKILDYGTGGGYFLQKLIRETTSCVVVGYEPVDTMFEELITNLQEEIADEYVDIVTEQDKLPRRYFDIVFCLELLEHLSEENQKLTINSLKELVVNDGIFVISVPIESGLASLMKNIVRLSIGGTHKGTSVNTILKSIFSLPINREESSYISSHLGFYYKDLERKFGDYGLVIVKKMYSPFNILKGTLNSQVIYAMKAVN